MGCPLLEKHSKWRSRHDEQCTSAGWHAKGRIHPYVRWKTRSMGSERSAFRGLGNLSLERIPRRSESFIRLAIDQLVRPDDPALRRRLQNAGARRSQMHL